MAHKPKTPAELSLNPVQTAPEARMIPQKAQRTVITERDLRVLTEVVLRRFSSVPEEDGRIRRIRGVLDAASDLSKALELQTRYALVDHRGTHGANDLQEATRVLYHALEAYAARLSELGEQYPEFAAPLNGISKEMPAAASL
jgi:hypothetical protein